MKLCIKTWIKFLPDYEINILNMKNLKNYIGETLYSNIIYKKLPLPIQADAIRVALLKKYGGIWMDTDIIITNGDFLKKLNNFELVMIGDEKIKSQHIGFIYASKNCHIMSAWLKEIINRINTYRGANIKFQKKKKSIKWNYLGNGIIDGLLKNNTNKNFFILNKNEMNAFPEVKYYERSSLNNMKKYKRFYFHKGDAPKILKNVKGIILLHNSWTPLKYKNMSEKQFLSQNILLSNMLEYLLK